MKFDIIKYGKLLGEYNPKSSTVKINLAEIWRRWEGNQRKSIRLFEGIVTHETLHHSIHKSVNKKTQEEEIILRLTR